LNFKYTNSVIITKELSDNKIEKTVEDHGQASFDLILLDYIYYRLKNKNKLRSKRCMSFATFLPMQ